VDRKLASIGLIIACVLASCGDTTSATPLPSPSGSPMALVGASPPVVNGVQAAARSADRAPSASAASRPTPTPDPESIRHAAAAQYVAALLASAHAFDAFGKEPSQGDDEAAAALWGRLAADLEEIRVPADTAADLRHLIGTVTAIQALEVRAQATRSAAAWFRVRGAISRAVGESSVAEDRVRSDLGLPASAMPVVLIQPLG